MSWGMQGGASACPTRAHWFTVLSTVVSDTQLTYFPSLASSFNCSGISQVYPLSVYRQAHSWSPCDSPRGSVAPPTLTAVSHVPGFLLGPVLPKAAVSDLARGSGSSPPAALRRPSLICRPVLSVFTQACVGLSHTLSRPSRADFRCVLLREMCTLKM